MIVNMFKQNLSYINSPLSHHSSTRKTVIVVVLDNIMFILTVVVNVLYIEFNKYTCMLMFSCEFTSKTNLPAASSPIQMSINMNSC